MSIELRNALNRLIGALEYHYDVAVNSEVVRAEILDEAEDRLMDAFFTYDDELYTRFGVELPFEMLEEGLDEDGPEGLDDDTDPLSEQIIIGPAE